MEAGESGAAPAGTEMRTNTKRAANSTVPRIGTLRLDACIIFVPPGRADEKIMKSPSLKREDKSAPPVLDTVLHCSMGRGAGF